MKCVLTNDFMWFASPDPVHRWVGLGGPTNSIAIDHIALDCNAYVDFRRISKESRSIYMGNNTSVNVLGIGTCKLLMRKDHTLYLHDVLYAPEVRQNLVSVVVLVKLDFKIVFEQDLSHPDPTLLADPNRVRGARLYTGTH